MTVTTDYDVDVVHIAITVVVELREVYLRVGGFGLLCSLNDEGLRVDVVTRATEVGSVVGAFVVERVRPYYGEVGHELSHRVVTIVVFDRTCAAILAIALFVEPSVEVAIGEVELAEVFTLFGFARLGIDFAASHAGGKCLADGHGLHVAAQ